MSSIYISFRKCGIVFRASERPRAAWPSIEAVLARRTPLLVLLDGLGSPALDSWFDLTQYNSRKEA